MKSRLAASVVLSALVLASATGCTFITPQASTIPYSASDGVNVSDAAGPLDVRNAMVIVDEEGLHGNFVAGIVNTTAEAQTLNVQIDGADALRVVVSAQDSISLGADAEPLFIDSVNAQPGSTLTIRFQSGDGEGEFVEVPVLDGTLPYYSDLVPVAPVVEPAPIETEAPTDEGDVPADGEDVAEETPES